MSNIAEILGGFRPEPANPHRRKRRAAIALTGALFAPAVLATPAQAALGPNQCRIEVTTMPETWDDNIAHGQVQQTCFDDGSIGGHIVHQGVVARMQREEKCYVFRKCWKTKDEDSKQKSGPGPVVVDLVYQCPKNPKPGEWRIVYHGSATRRDGKSDRAIFPTDSVRVTC